MQTPQDAKIRLSDLIAQLVATSAKELHSLSDKLKTKNEVDRKITLIKYFKKTRIQFIRLLILIDWSDRKSVLDKAMHLLDSLDKQDRTFTETADQLYWLQHAYLRDKNCDRVPIYDIPTAVEVLNKGTYKKLPSSLEHPHQVIGNILPKKNLDEKEIVEVKRKLEEKIKIKLLWENIPSQYLKPIIDDGRLLLEVMDEFKVSLTLLDESYSWTILDVDIFVSPHDVSSYVGVKYLAVIREKAQEAIDNSVDPLDGLYDFMHSFCQVLQLDILLKQAEYTKQVAGAISIGDIRFEEGSFLQFNIWHPSVTERNYQMNISASTYKENPEEKKPIGLIVTHNPPLLDQHGREVFLTVKPQSVSLDTILTEATKYHSFNLLKQLYDRIVRSIEKKPVLNDPNTLYLSLSNEDVSFLNNEDLTDCSIKIRIFETYCLSIVVSQRTGTYRIQELPVIKNLDIKSLEDQLARSYEDIVKVLVEIQLAVSKYGIFKLLKSLQINVQTKFFHKDLAKHEDGIFVLKLLPHSLTQNLVIKFYKVEIRNSDGGLEYGCVNIKMYKLSRNDVTELPLGKISSAITNSEEETTPKENGVVYSNTSKRLKRDDTDVISTHGFHDYFVRQDTSFFYKFFSKVLSSYNKHLYLFLLLDLFERQKVVLVQEPTEDQFNPPYLYTIKFELKNFERDAHLTLYKDSFVISMEMKDGLVYPVTTKFTEKSNISYDVSTKSWIFQYQTINSDSVKLFKSDYLRLLDVLQLIDQYEYYVQNVETRNFFKLAYITFDSIVLVYGPQYQYSVSIMSLNAPHMQIHFSPFESYFIGHALTEYTTSRDITTLLEMIWNTYTADIHIRQFCVSLASYKNIMQPYFLVHSISSGRLHLDSQLYFELRFPGDQIIILEMFKHAKYEKINALFLATTLKELKSSGAYDMYIDASTNTPDFQIIEGECLSFKHVFFPGLLQKVKEEMLKL